MAARKSKVAAASPASVGLTQEITIPTVGDHPFVPADEQFIKNLSTVLDKAVLGDKNPLWNNERELETMRVLSALTSQPGMPGSINERFSKLYPVSDLNLPKDTVSILQMSYRYAYENPFVAKALRVKTDFTCKDFHHQTTHNTVKEFYDGEVLRLRLRTKIREIVWNLVALGIAPVYWGGEEGEGINFIDVLDPRTVHIERIHGVAKLYLKIDQSMMDAVRDPEGKIDVTNRVRFQSMPKYWIPQIKDYLEHFGEFGAMGGKGLIELKDGSYTVVSNRYASHNRVLGSMDGVPLQPAFDALQKYRLMSAGDFAVAWQIKNMITLISEGDPKLEGAKYIPTDTARLQKLQGQFQRPDYAFTVFCDSTTQVRFVTPPIEVFDPKKYAQAEKEIKENLNLPGFMWISDGSGDTFGSASAELKLLREEVDSIRLFVGEQFFYPLYTRLRVESSRPGFKAKDIVLPSFDQNSLREDTVWLSAVSELYGRGGCSLRTLCETYGFDFEYEMAELKQEHEKYGPSDTSIFTNDTQARPLFEPNQGNLKVGVDHGGNPRTDHNRPDSKIDRAPRSKSK